MSSRSITVPSGHPAHAWPGGCRVTVVPGRRHDEIMRHEPDGIFLSNGPGPAAPANTPCRSSRHHRSGHAVFGICLGISFWRCARGKTKKMPLGHPGAQHPVKELATGR